MKKMKKGAASFYIVAFSTLILLIIAASFTALVIAQVTRTSNDDLSQSAYDSALAGIEDAKLAFYNYRNCLSNGAVAEEPTGSEDSLSCNNVVWLVEKSNDCDAVPYILGRKQYQKDSDIEGTDDVVIQESNTSANNMQQAYTCVKIQTELKDYRGTLSPSNQMKVVKLKFGNDVKAKDIRTMRISWGVVESSSDVKYSNFDKGDGVVFSPIGAMSGSLKSPANPPTIAVALLQTANEFTMDDFKVVDTAGGRTDRGMAFLVPTEESADASKSKDGNYIGVYNGSKGENYVTKDKIVKSNDRTRQNVPFSVYCPKSGANTGEFVCSTVIELPEPINGERSDENFVVAMSLPYGQPSTEFSLEFFCDEGVVCGNNFETIDIDSESEGGETPASGGTNQASLNVQLGIDSTGRASDLFRRVEARLQGVDDYNLSLMGPLELFGSNGSSGNDSTGLRKNYTVTCEYDFEPTCSR